MANKPHPTFDREADLGGGWTARLVGTETEVKLSLRSPNGHHTYLSTEETEKLRNILNVVTSR